MSDKKQKQEININQKAWKFIQDMNSSEERLDSIALVDSKREYTYRQMFYWWDRYAEVFSALGITGRNKSRVAVMGFGVTEITFMFYALNMTGAVYAGKSSIMIFKTGQWKEYVKETKITDIIIEDILLGDNYISDILRNKEEYGIRNVIVFHSSVVDSIGSNIIKDVSNLRYRRMKRNKNLLYMEELLEKYDGTPIVRERYNANKISFILQTTGSNSGKSKPVMLTDLNMNAGAARFINDNKLRKRIEGTRVSVTLPQTCSFSVVDMTHMPLSMGCALVNCLMQSFIKNGWKIITDNKIGILFTSAPFVENWMKLPESTPFDFSCLKAVALGGTYVSQDDRKKINKFFNDHGADNIMVANGYGMTEVGGALTLSMDDNTDDSIGYPLKGVDIKIYDEDEDKYYSIKDGERTGILFVNTDCMTAECLDGKRIHEITEINGKPYLNSMDAVRVNPDKSLTYMGRANRYYVNNEGVRFDASLIETAISSKDGIENCVMVPMFFKRLHDTVPVIYVICRWNGLEAAAEFRKILLEVFIDEGLTKKTNLPVKCVFVDKLPLNLNGKIDIYAIQHMDIDGRPYDIKPIRVDGELKDIHLVPGKRLEYNFMQKNIALPDEIAEEMRENMSKDREERRQEFKEKRQEFEDRMEERRHDFEDKMEERRHDFEDKMEERKQEFKEKGPDFDKIRDDMKYARSEMKKEMEERREEWKKEREERKPNFDKIRDDWEGFLKDLDEFLDAYRVDAKDLRENKEFKEFFDKRREAMKEFWKDKDFEDIFEDLRFVPIPIPFGTPRRPMPFGPFMGASVARGRMRARRAGRAMATAFVGARPHRVHRRGAKPQFKKLGKKPAGPRPMGKRPEMDPMKLMELAGVLFKQSPIDYFFEK